MKIFDDPMSLEYDAPTNTFVAKNSLEWKPWWQLSESEPIPEFKFSPHDVSSYDLSSKKGRQKLTIITARRSIWLWLRRGESEQFLNAISLVGKTDSLIKADLLAPVKIIQPIFRSIGLLFLIVGGYAVFEAYRVTKWTPLEAKVVSTSVVENFMSKGGRKHNLQVQYEYIKDGRPHLGIVTRPLF